MRDNFIDPYFENLMASDYVEPEEPQSLMQAQSLIGYGPEYGPPGSGEPMYADKPTSQPQMQQNQGAPAPQQMQPQMQQNQGAPQLYKSDWFDAVAFPKRAAARRKQSEWERDSYFAKQYIRKYGTNYGPEMGKEMMDSQSTTLMKKAMEFKPDKNESNPTTVKEYNFAKTNGYKGTYPQFLQEVKKGGVNIVNQMPSAPLKGAEAKNWYNKEGQHPKTQADLNTGNYSVRTTAETGTANKGRKASAIVDEYERMLLTDDNALYKGQGNDLFDRLKFVATTNYQQFAQSDPRYKQAADFTQGTLSSMVRSLADEVGTLAEGDVERAYGLVPRVTGINPDSKEVVVDKIDKMRRLIAVSDMAKREGRKITTGEIDKIIGFNGKKPVKTIDFNTWK